MKYIIEWKYNAQETAICRNQPIHNLQDKEKIGRSLIDQNVSMLRSY